MPATSRGDPSRRFALLPSASFDAADFADGLTVEGGDWWFNLRPSNTEPLLRLNVEAATEAEMARVRDGVLEDQLSAPLVTKDGATFGGTASLKSDDKSLWGNNLS